MNTGKSKKWDARRTWQRTQALNRKERREDRDWERDLRAVVGNYYDLKVATEGYHD